MIRPEDFYRAEDLPERHEQQRMWNVIQRTLRPVSVLAMLIPDRRSFVYGMAATVFLYLASLGAWDLVHSAIEGSQPTEVKIGKAYSEAIDAFEQVLPAVVARASAPQYSDALSSRMTQLRLIDAAIADLRKDTAPNDLSPLKQARLRELYSLKLRILQRMIENGELEL